MSLAMFLLIFDIAIHVFCGIELAHRLGRCGKWCYRCAREQAARLIERYA